MYLHTALIQLQTIAEMFVLVFSVRCHLLPVKIGAMTMARLMLGIRFVVNSHISATLTYKWVDMMCIICSVRPASSFEDLRMAFSCYSGHIMYGGPYLA